MENLFKAVLHLVSTYGSMLKYEKLVHLINNCGGDVGDRLHSRKTASRMVECIAHVWRADLRDLMTATFLLQTSNDFWGGQVIKLLTMEQYNG